MKTPTARCSLRPCRFPVALAATGLLMPLLALAGGFVYENPAEFLASGDFDGDGRTDALIVDRDSGVYRVGYQTPTGSLAWAEARAGGVEDVAGVTAGRLTSTNFDALAMAAPAANRVNVIEADQRSAPEAPMAVHPYGLGAATVVALDTLGGGNTPHDDLVVWSGWNGSAIHQVAFMRAPGLTNYAQAGTLIKLARGNAVAMDPARVKFGAFMDRRPGAGLTVLDLTNALLMRPIFITNLNVASDYAAGVFGTNLFNFLVYVPGQDGLTSYRIDKPASYRVAATNVFTLGAAIGQVFIVQARGSNMVFVVFTNGATGTFYSYDGSSGLTPLQSLSAPAGARLTGVAPLGTNDFALLSGDPASCRTTNATVYRFSGTLFTAGAAAAVPAPAAYAGKANVLLYREEPMVSSRPGRVAAWHVNDWSAAIMQSGTVAHVLVWRDTGATTGLVSAGSATLGPVPASAHFAMPNQKGTNYSVFCLDAAAGAGIPVVSIAPPPGAYQAAVFITLTNEAALPMYYRRDANLAWSLYTTGFFIFRDCTIQYYAGARDPTAGPVAATTPKSPIQSAAYTLVADPDALDSDGDGVPDYVELAYGLDPVNSGSDGDGDGLLDLEELLRGTNPNLADSDGDTWIDLTELRYGSDPNNAADHPPADAVISNDIARVEQDAVFDQYLVPRPYDGIMVQSVNAASGTTVRASALGGSLLASAAVTTNRFNGTNVDYSVRFQRLVVDRPPALFSVITDPNMAIATGNWTDGQLIGRELLGMVPAPEAFPLAVPYHYAGAGLAVEGSNWVHAAQTTFTNGARLAMLRDLDYLDTLAALLIERKVGDLLSQRGVTTNRLITLFPGRDGDAGLDAPTAATLNALQDQTTNGLPGYRLADLHATITGQLSNVFNADINMLRYLDQFIYQISSRDSDVSNGYYRLPATVLREYISSGRMDAAYSNRLGWGEYNYSRAWAGVTTILAAVQSRPVRSFTGMSVRTNSFSNGCSMLWDADSNAWSLVRANGTPYPFTEAFQLLPGTLFDVSGYTDAAGGSCGAGLEVITLVLTEIPRDQSAHDAANLLPEAWQRLTFGRTGINPYEDSDGDGYDNIQEYLEGTDASRAADSPAGSGIPVADLADLECAIALQPAGTARLSWFWPARYVADFIFDLQDAPTLFQPFQYSDSAPQGMTYIDLSISTNSVDFYRLRLQLR